MSPFPVYSKICVADSRSIWIPKRFEGRNVNIDPDLPIYYKNWMEHLAEIVRKFYELDNLWNLNGGRFNISYTEWSFIPSYEREALKKTAAYHIEESNKQHRQLEADRKKELEQAKQHQSAFTGITMPRFQN